MLCLLALFFLTVASGAALAADTVSDRTELLRLLEVRAGRFREYSESLRQKSGLFGQRTKNDLKMSHDRLAAIVELDNMIIRVLDRMLGQRTFERVTMTYDASRDAERIANLQAVADTMTARAARFEAELATYKTSRNGKSGWLWFFVLLALAEGILLFRFKKRRQEARG
jgi:hypothetical protein